MLARHRTIRLGESVEDPLLLVERNSNPGVPDGEVQTRHIGGVGFPCSGYQNLPCFRKLNRIPDQVYQYLTESSGIANQRVRHIRLYLVNQLQSFLRSAETECLHGLPQLLTQVEGNGR